MTARRLLIGSDRAGATPVARAGEIARGDYWSILREGDDYVLYHLSRGLAGREKRVPLHEREARAVAAGQLSVELFVTPDA